MTELVAGREVDARARELAREARDDAHSMRRWGAVYIVLIAVVLNIHGCRLERLERAEKAWHAAKTP